MDGISFKIIYRCQFNHERDYYHSVPDTYPLHMIDFFYDTVDDGSGGGSNPLVESSEAGDAANLRTYQTDPIRSDHDDDDPILDKDRTISRSSRVESGLTIKDILEILTDSDHVGSAKEALQILNRKSQELQREQQQQQGFNLPLLLGCSDS